MPRQPPGLFFLEGALRAIARRPFVSQGEVTMLSEVSGLVESALPVVGVITAGSLVAFAILAWLVREVAVRAIEKATPEQVAAVVIAVAELVSPLRWIWPWSAKASSFGSGTLPLQEDNKPSSGPQTKAQHEAQ
jgi:hypothetical protein